MRRSKSVGFLVICLGILLMIVAAVLPVSPATERFGPFRIDVRGDTCGPAGYVAFRHSPSDVCRSAAHRRLLSTSAIGLLVVALGMALFAGPEQRRGSMVVVGPSRPPSVRRRFLLRTPGSRR